MPRFVGLLLGLIISIPVFAADVPDFNRDVRPILSNHCFKCHGPATQKSGVRLDSQSMAAKKKSIVPGKPEESVLLEKIAADDSERMPPKESGPRLTPAQVETLKAWIAGGAKYDTHWAFTPPKRPTAPAGNPIDGFIKARLAKDGLTLSAEADKSTLIRRVTLDLTGLLPAPADVEAFVKDTSPNAYEKLVDRLLTSPHYGERQARHWLDLARYADSNGYTIDGARSIWPWRDWVIAAFNADKPFDQFTIEQLAGDLLPNATKEQIIATGFHRNTSFNEEGGTDAEQFRVERTVDRTNTTAAVWLGLTMGCAQCHDHKYDPLPQKDYYRLYAFFNMCDEPTITLEKAPEIEQQLAEMTARLAELRKGGNDEAVKKLLEEQKKVQAKVPTTMVMKERNVVRETFVQIRGDFLRKGDKVTSGFPTAISTGSPAKLNRLDLAKWLVSAENPLTARVTVNRFWQQFFGRGIVESENDFGMQGSAPTHPELLDWLAVEFRESGWSVKKFLKRIVMSETYRQSSAVRADLTAKDPQNKLFGRQSRLRLEAEIVRDAALSASGLLVPKIGGPGVYPPLPPEVFSFTQNKHPWPESKGGRPIPPGMYTFLWRQSQHHLLTTFDGADGQVACTRRNRSNTPLQALHLSNDPAFVEFADALGKRIVASGPSDDAGRVAYAFQICFSRQPTATEKDRVLAYLKVRTSADPATAWARAARVLLNLDEFITRE